MEERQDLISRRVAVDVVDFECGEWRGLAKTIIKKLEALPAVQPDHVADIGKKVEGDCIRRQMAIDADKLLRDIEHYNLSDGKFQHWVEIQPTIEKEPKKGEWIRNFDGNEWYWYCSSCKEQWYEEDLWMGGNSFPNFCPNCGADMRGEQE